MIDRAGQAHACDVHIACTARCDTRVPSTRSTMRSGSCSWPEEPKMRVMMHRHESMSAAIDERAQLLQWPTAGHADCQFVAGGPHQVPTGDKVSTCMQHPDMQPVLSKHIMSFHARSLSDAVCSALSIDMHSTVDGSRFPSLRGPF